METNVVEVAKNILIFFSSYDYKELQIELDRLFSDHPKDEAMTIIFLSI
jgi:hypothetical protein